MEIIIEPIESIIEMGFDGSCPLDFDCCVVDIDIECIDCDFCIDIN